MVDEEPEATPRRLDPLELRRVQHGVELGMDALIDLRDAEVHQQAIDAIHRPPRFVDLPKEHRKRTRKPLVGRHPGQGVVVQEQGGHGSAPGRLQPGGREQRLADARIAVAFVLRNDRGGRRRARGQCFTLCHARFSCLGADKKRGRRCAHASARPVEIFFLKRPSELCFPFELAVAALH
jgi:hypothetical protein